MNLHRKKKNTNTSDLLGNPVHQCLGTRRPRRPLATWRIPGGQLPRWISVTELLGRKFWSAPKKINLQDQNTKKHQEKRNQTPNLEALIKLFDLVKEIWSAKLEVDMSWKMIFCCFFDLFVGWYVALNKMQKFDSVALVIFPKPVSVMGHPSPWGNLPAAARQCNPCDVQIHHHCFATEKRKKVSNWEQRVFQLGLVTGTCHWLHEFTRTPSKIWYHRVLIVYQP